MQIMFRPGFLFGGLLVVMGCVAAFAPVNFNVLSSTNIAVSGGEKTTFDIKTKLNAAALIIQNKGGGHGEIGFQLAKKLSTNDKIDSITILQDDVCDMKSEPFKSYASLPDDVTVVYAKLGDKSVDAKIMQRWLGGDDVKFQYIYDNYSKGPEGSSKSLLDCVNNWGDCKLYTYVSSAGIYQATDKTEFPMGEDTTPIKKSAGQAKMDNYVSIECNLPLVSFRPQYIYGEKSNKYDYIDWYFDRLTRNLPLPIPSPGTQTVSLTNSQDVASLLAAPLDNEEAAVKQRFFNCGTDKLVTYDEVAFLCAEVAGIPKKEVQIVHYSGDALGKGNFPFRLTDFYVAPDMAKEKLGYLGATNDLKDDLKWYYEEYNKTRREKKNIDLVKDREIIIGSKIDANVYDQYINN